MVDCFWYRFTTLHSSRKITSFLSIFHSILSRTYVYSSIVHVFARTIRHLIKICIVITCITTLLKLFTCHTTFSHLHSLISIVLHLLLTHRVLRYVVLKTLHVSLIAHRTCYLFYSTRFKCFEHCHIINPTVSLIHHAKSWIFHRLLLYQMQQT